ncbi:MAG: protein kinase domain-containing protein [Ktedonobacterales bacterium]
MSLPLGIVLARRYRVLAQLGEGGMGSVYKVEDTAHRSRVFALKELLDDSTASPEDVAWAKKRFDDEIELMRHLTHPRIPSFVESFYEGGRRYFVMEYIPGDTLEQRLERTHGPLPERDVLRWMMGICNVLTYLHEQRRPIIVRDLKPGNIMVTPSGDARLIDFGIARTYKAGQRTNTENLGTMTYASPEHLGKTQTDPRSDIYSLGATMYHLLTGHEPVPLQTPAPGSLRQLQPSLSAATEDVVIRAMQIDPQRRFQTAAEMKDAIGRCLDAMAIAAPAAPSPGGSRQNAPVVLPRGAGMSPASPASRVAASAPAKRGGAVAPAVGRACPSCGYVNRANARFCARDGEPLVASAQRVARAVPATAVVPALGGTAELHVQRATESFSAGRYSQTILQCAQAIAAGRATYDVYLMQAQAYTALGRFAEAARVFAQAAALRPTAEALAREGVAWRKAGDLGQAQIALTRARALDPRDAELAYQLGMVCVELGQLAQAEGELRDALTMRPNDAPALVGLGRVAAARSQLNDALALFDRALAADPKNADARLERGRVLLARQRPSEAIPVLEEAARLAPGSVEAHTLLGVSYHAVGRRAQARQSLQRAVALDANATEARRLLKQV